SPKNYHRKRRSTFNNIGKKRSIHSQQRLNYVINFKMLQEQMYLCERFQIGSTREEWNHVIFTDESRFGLHSDSRRVRAWRTPETRHNSSFIQEVHPFRDGSVMAWGEIFLGGRTELHNCNGNMNAQL
ncbi:hypothetical protein BDFB_012099, partial [Asbolus verrucosus]